MKLKLADRKNPLTYAIFSTINRVAINRHFRSIEIRGLEHLPRAGGFILVSNHISRWDGLLWYYLIGRPSNFMVSPDELSGLQGTILQAMGSFPASTKYDLHNHVRRQLSKGEAVVVFPEGDIYRDGTTHRFKSGTARLALKAAEEGIAVPIVPAAIQYVEDGKNARISLAPPVMVADYLASNDQPKAVQSLTERLHREVCHLRYELGCAAEAHSLFSAVHALRKAAG